MRLRGSGMKDSYSRDLKLLRLSIMLLVKGGVFFTLGACEAKKHAYLCNPLQQGVVVREAKANSSLNVAGG